LIRDNLFAVIDDGVPLPVLLIVSSWSLGGIGSGQWVVPVKEIISFPRRPNGLARYNS